MMAMICDMVLVFAITFGGENDVFGGGQQPQAA